MDRLRVSDAVVPYSTFGMKNPPSRYPIVCGVAAECWHISFIFLPFFLGGHPYYDYSVSTWYAGDDLRPNTQQCYGCTGGTLRAWWPARRLELPDDIVAACILGGPDVYRNYLATLIDTKGGYERLVLTKEPETFIGQKP